MKRPIALYLLLFLHLFLSIGAVYGGISLITDPLGFGMQAAWLDHTPFDSYVIPGLILLFFNGIFPLFILFGLLRKPEWPWAESLNIYRDRHWAWTFSLYSGLIQIGWINGQIMMVPFFWLQPVMLGWGLLTVIFTLWPGVMLFYWRPEVAGNKTLSL